MKKAGLRIIATELPGMYVLFSRGNTNDVRCHVPSLSDGCENLRTGDGFRNTEHYKDANLTQVSSHVYT